MSGAGECNHKLIGQRIRHLRRVLGGVTQEKFVARVNEHLPRTMAVTTLSTWERKGALRGGKVPGPDHQVLAAIYHAFIEHRRESEPFVSFRWLITGDGDYNASVEEQDRDQAHLASARVRPVGGKPEAIDSLVPEDLRHLPDRAKQALLSFIRDAVECEALTQSVEGETDAVRLLEERGPYVSSMDPSVDDWLDSINASISDHVFGVVRQAFGGGDGWRSASQLRPTQLIAVVESLVAAMRPIVRSFETKPGDIYLSRSEAVSGNLRPF